MDDSDSTVRRGSKGLIWVDMHIPQVKMREKVFAVLGLVTLDERTPTSEMFSDYKLSLHIVKLVTLAHLEYFAGAQRAVPILRALRINRGHEILRLTKIARRLDNLGVDNPVVDAEFIHQEYHRD
jgi:hypothetical protein